MDNNGNAADTGGAGCGRPSSRRKVCIATSTRADWGLLSPLAKALKERPDIELSVLATNMHLNPRYGMTIKEIADDGIDVEAEVEMNCEGDDDVSRVKAMSQCMAGSAEAFGRMRPDVLVILGDRYEMLAIASAAEVMRIPIVHIAGGEISEGAIDDSIRHAITKLSSLHLTATDAYRRRVIQMGESPSNVINTGALGVYNIRHEQLMTKKELEESIGFELGENAMLVTYHPATLDDARVRDRCAALLAALDRFPESKVIITYPNNDTGSEAIISQLEEYARKHPRRVCLVKSLGKKRYLSALKYVGAVVGNSSSGIVEVPSMGIPTVNIGIRQKGRISARSVIHCGDSADEIYRAISYALSSFGQSLASSASNPYYKANTLSTMVKAIAEKPLSSLQTKHFYDIIEQA